ncbi:MAG: phosphoribosyltransferase [Alcanivorax sp.]|nr:phosphoribosyltransferase [Alcanivorax sp.]
MADKATITVELIPWSRIEDTARRCARWVRRDAFQPDLVVAIARGGFIPARLLCDHLGIHRLAGIQVSHYGAGAQVTGQARVVTPLNVDVHGRKVLLVDDVNDSGATLAVALDYLRALSPAALKVAVLVQKERSPVPVDYYGQLLESWRWLTFPWARVEDISDFAERLLPGERDHQRVRAALYQAHGIRPDDCLLDDAFAFADSESVQASE